jgi:hypothetical protein
MCGSRSEHMHSLLQSKIRTVLHAMYNNTYISSIRRTAILGNSWVTALFAKYEAQLLWKLGNPPEPINATVRLQKCDARL